MPQIFHNDFSAGWCPSDNYINGRRNALLQMNNLCLDDNGALTSCRAPKSLTSSLPARAHTLYSATISGVQKQLAALEDGSIVEGATFSNSLASGGSTKRAAFSNALDQILICSGTVNKKWDGTTLRNLGLATPTAPVVSANPTQKLSIANLDGSHLFTNWVLDNGTAISDTAYAYKFNPDATSLIAQLHTVFSSPFNGTTFPGGDQIGANDRIQFQLTFSTALPVLAIQMAVYPDDGAGNPDEANAFFYQWNTGNNIFPVGQNVTQQFSASRLDFADPTLSSSNYFPSQDKWKIIKAVKINILTNAVIDITLGDIYFIGGAFNALTGAYEYLQVNVIQNNTYQAQSPASPLSTANPAISSVHVVPAVPSDAQVNHVWIFRRNTLTQGNYYRIADITTPFSAFNDGMSDTDAALLAIVPNLFLDNISNLSTGILEIIGLWFNRVLFFDNRSIYFSDDLNIDSIDTQKSIVYSGNTSEVFLWARKVSNSVILVGTDLDVYELNGTWAALADGTLDCSIRPLGFKQPPVSIAATVFSSQIIYQGNDGWRISDGVNNNRLSDDLDILFKGTSTNLVKYGYSQITDGYFAGVIFANCAISQNKLYTVAKDTAGIYKCFIYDMVRKYWYVYQDGLYALWVTDAGTILGSGGTSISLLEFDATVGVNIQALFTVNDGTIPNAYAGTDHTISRQRKDSYTFKTIAKAGGTITVAIYKDKATYGTAPVTIGTITSNGETIIDISSSVGITKAYQVQLSGNGIIGFSLLDWSIDYDMRPTALTHYRQPPTNFGSAGKKRISVIPFVIDTLGTNVTYTPTVDGISYTAQTFNTNEKTTVFYYFSVDVFGIEVSGILQGGLFENYGFLQPEIVEVIPPQRLRDQVGPVQFTRQGILKVFRFRVYPYGTTITARVYCDDVLSYTVNVTVTPNLEKAYEVIVPRGTTGQTMRWELQSTSPFHRMSFDYKATITGGQSELGWKTIAPPEN